MNFAEFLDVLHLGPCRKHTDEFFGVVRKFLRFLSKNVEALSLFDFRPFFGCIGFSLLLRWSCVLSFPLGSNGVPGASCCPAFHRKWEWQHRTLHSVPKCSFFGFSVAKKWALSFRFQTKPFYLNNFLGSLNNTNWATALQFFTFFVNRIAEIDQKNATNSLARPWTAVPFRMLIGRSCLWPL